MKLRGSAATEPKIIKIRPRNQPENRKSFAFYPALKMRIFRYLSMRKTHTHNVMTSLSFCMHLDINIIHPIPEFHLNLTTRFRVMPRKPTSKQHIVFIQMDGPRLHPPILLFEVSSINRSIPALRVMYTVWNCAAAQRHSPKTLKFDHGISLKPQNISYFTPPWKCEFSFTCAPVKLPFILYARTWACACTQI